MPPFGETLSVHAEEEPVAEWRRHLPVLPRETLALLAAQPGEVVVDATVGQGGHAEALLEAIGPAGRLLGIDRDPAALDAAGRVLARFGGRFVALRGDHRDFARLLGDAGVRLVDGVLLDLGVSSAQLDDPERGFSFSADGPLDMRMDPDSELTAARLLAELSEQELARIFWRYGEERRSRAIARAIVRERTRGPLLRTVQLARLLERALGAAGRRSRIHPATRTFQALRITVNGELEALDSSLAQAVAALRSGGRLVVIAFHSLEDRIVKNSFRTLANPCVCPPALPVCGCGRQSQIRILTSRPLRPSPAEIASNPRSRSARLRAAEKL